VNKDFREGEHEMRRSSGLSHAPNCFCILHSKHRDSNWFLHEILSWKKEYWPGWALQAAWLLLISIYMHCKHFFHLYVGHILIFKHEFFKKKKKKTETNFCNANINDLLFIKLKLLFGRLNREKTKLHVLF